MKYSTSSSTGLSLFDSDLGVSLFNSVSSIVPVAVPGKDTNVAVALDDDDNDVLSETSRHSSMFGEKVTLLTSCLDLTPSSLPTSPHLHISPGSRVTMRPLKISRDVADQAA